MMGAGTSVRRLGLLGAWLVLGAVVSRLGIDHLRTDTIKASVWWPLVGLGVALIARLPRRRQWALALAGLMAGQFFTLVPTYYGPLMAGGITVANVVEIVLICSLLQRFFPDGVVLTGLRGFLVFAAIALGGMLVGSGVYALVRYLLSADQVLLMSSLYARNHTLGLLMVSPLFLLGPDRSWRAELRHWRVNLEWAVQLAVLVATTLVVVRVAEPALVLLCLLPLSWGAQRLGPLRAVVSLLLMSVLLTVYTLHDVGPLAGPDPARQVLVLQVVLAAATLTVLFLGVSAAEKDAALHETQQWRRDLADAERISGTGSSTWDLVTGAMRWSDGLYRQLGLVPGSAPPVATTYLARVHPDDREHVADTLARAPEVMGIPTMEFRLVRPDGDERVVIARTETTLGRAHSTVQDVTAIREAEQALRRAHNELAAIMDAVTEVAIVGASVATGLITFTNHGARNLLGWEAGELVGRVSPTLFHVESELEWAMAETGLDDPLAALNAVTAARGTGRWTCVRKDGTEFPGQLSLTPYAGPDGRVEGVIGTLVDLTGALRAQAELQESEDRFRLAFDGAPVGMAITSLGPEPPGTLMQVNGAFCVFVQQPEEKLVGRVITELLDPAHRDGARQNLERLAAGEIDYVSVERPFRRSTGDPVWGLVNASRVRPADGREPYLIMLLEDVTARRELNDRLEHEATHDQLTGLANRKDLRRRLERALTDTSRQVALIYIDLDGFKAVNDTEGHSAGDELLIQVADRIAACVRAGDVVARQGGDEFAVLCPGVPDAQTARRLGERIVRVLAEEFQLTSASCRIGGSVGIAVSGAQEGGDTAAGLIHAADEAMYRAKRGGKGRVSY